MALTESLSCNLKQEGTRVPSRVLAAELDFFESYPWCLNPHLTVREAIDHLGAEIDRLATVQSGWQTREVATNIFLLSCGLLNCVDEHLRGPSLRLPWKLAEMRLGRGARWGAENVLGSLRRRPAAGVRRWRKQWLAGLDEFLSVIVAGRDSDPSACAAACGGLAMVLKSQLPSALQANPLGVPSPFRRLDLTHLDILALGRCYVSRFPDRSQAILLLGLRTSGSYFAPLLRAFFEAEGYGNVSVLTIVPGKGPGRWEAKELKRHADEGYTAVIVDDPPHTGGTIFTAFEIARRAGFGLDKLRALVPSHPTKRDWFKPLSDDLVISLAPEKWHKRALLEPKEVQARLDEYFGKQDFVRSSVVASTHVERLNASLLAASSDERGARLKRIFEVHLETFQGRKEIRYVLAKSVGWGWLGYHAFLAGRRLAGFVPPILGMRDGILYMEWIPQVASQLGIDSQKAEWIERSASYVAARAQRLSLDAGTTAQSNLGRQDNGAGLLGKALSRVYGGFFLNLLTEPRLKRMLGRLSCPFPTLIDGNMRPSEWIVGSGVLLKTDYEHHGLGKEELNVIDPAYDLADAILNLDLSPKEERRLIGRYIDQSGDVGVDQRLFMSKMLAGLWTMKQAHAELFSKARIAGKQQAVHQRFLQAWHFLTVQAARQCGGYRRAVSEPHWRSPFVMTDVDGVLDRRLFGFPCTTAAGIEALSILDAHQIPVALNTARSVAEVKEYCQAYSLAGAVAEHGSYMWDAVNRRGRILISREAQDQLQELRNHLQRIPGVFLDSRHEHSIRAFTYLPKPSGVLSTLLRLLRSSGVGDGVLTPLPTLLIQQLIADHGLDRLSFHQTTIDTTVVAKEVNKGSGLLALRDWVLGPDAETIAIGDQQPDLAMFSVATRSFAPANVGCAREARLLGCQITRHSYQRGFLEMANVLTHADGHRRKVRAHDNAKPVPGTDLFMHTLQIADRKWTTNLMSALFGNSKYRPTKVL